MSGGARGDIDEVGTLGLDHRRGVAIGTQPKVSRKRFRFRWIEVAGSYDSSTAYTLPGLHLNTAEKTAADGYASKDSHLISLDSKWRLPGRGWNVLASAKPPNRGWGAGMGSGDGSALDNVSLGALHKGKHLVPLGFRHGEMVKSSVEMTQEE